MRLPEWAEGVDASHVACYIHICRSGNFESEYKTAIQQAASLPITEDSDILERSSS